MQRHPFVTAATRLVRTVSSDVFGRWTRTQGNAMQSGTMLAPNTCGPMLTGMGLFERHEPIRRQVTDLPDGGHGVTKPADPVTAVVIPDLGIGMFVGWTRTARSLSPVSNTVPQISVSLTKYQRKLDNLPDCACVTAASSDPEMVAVIKVPLARTRPSPYPKLSAMKSDMLG